MGIILAVLVGAMLLGGARRIGQAAEKLVPVASVGYILLCTGVLLVRFDAVPGAFVMIFRGAFSPKAVTGGVVGSMLRSLRVGCSRGVFTNEAGMGSLPMRSATASLPVYLLTKEYAARPLPGE